MKRLENGKGKRWMLLLGMVGLLLAGMTGCTSKGSSLEGRWEMSVGEDPSLMGQEYGVDNLTYTMELNFSERTFPADNLSNGQNSYGWMDFSTMARMYRYEIDSVSYIGQNRYRVVSMDNWLSLNVDTLTYNPQTKEIIYNSDWKFKCVSGNTLEGGSSTLSGLGKWVLAWAVLLVVCQIVLNVRDIEGSARFWTPISMLVVLSGLILYLAYMTFAHERGLEVVGSNFVDVLKFYGGVLLVSASFAFGLLSLLIHLHEEFGGFSKIPTIIAAVIAVVILAVQMFTGNMMLDIFVDRFWVSLTYQDGLFGFIMALLVVLLGLMFVIQMIVFAVSLKGVMRTVTLLAFPVIFMAGIMLLVSLMSLVIFILIVCLVIAIGVAFLKSGSQSTGGSIFGSFNQSASQKGNNSTDADDNDIIIEGAGVLGGDVKAKDVSAFGDKSLLRDENGTYYKRESDGQYRET